MTVARAALKELKWSNKATFKFNSFATQIMGHYKTLEQGGHGVSDQEKVIQLLESTNTNNSCIQTQIKLVQQRVTFQDAITRLSTSIATVFTLINQKGRKALISETGTGWKKDFKTHCNGI